MNSTPLVIKSTNNHRAIGRDQPDALYGSNQIAQINQNETFNDDVEERMELDTAIFEDLEQIEPTPTDEIMTSEDSDEEYVPGVRPKPKRSARIKELPKKQGKKEVAAISSAVVKKPTRGRKKKKSESEDEFSG